MAETKDTQEKDEKAAAPSSKAEPKAEKFDRDQLVSNSRTLLNQPPHIVVGALEGVKGNGPVTLKEAGAAVDRFLNRTVKEN